MSSGTAKTERRFEVAQCSGPEGSCMNCGNLSMMPYKFRLGSFVARLCRECWRELRKEMNRVCR